MSAAMTGGWIVQANRVAVSAGCNATLIVADKAKKSSTTNQILSGQPIGVEGAALLSDDDGADTFVDELGIAPSTRIREPEAISASDANQTISERLPEVNRERGGDEPAAGHTERTTSPTK